MSPSANACLDLDWNKISIVAENISATRELCYQYSAYVNNSAWLSFFCPRYNNTNQNNGATPNTTDEVLFELISLHRTNDYIQLDVAVSSLIVEIPMISLLGVASSSTQNENTAATAAVLTYAVIKVEGATIHSLVRRASVLPTTDTIPLTAELDPLGVRSAFRFHNFEIGNITIDLFDFTILQWNETVPGNRSTQRTRSAKQALEEEYTFGTALCVLWNVSVMTSVNLSFVTTATTTTSTTNNKIPVPPLLKLFASEANTVFVTLSHNSSNPPLPIRTLQYTNVDFSPNTTARSKYSAYVLLAAGSVVHSTFFLTLFANTSVEMGTAALVRVTDRSVVQAFACQMMQGSRIVTLVKDTNRSVHGVIWMDAFAHVGSVNIMLYDNVSIEVQNQVTPLTFLLLQNTT